MHQVNKIIASKSFSSNNLQIDNAGDLWQLPPIYDAMVTDHSNLDGRPSCSQSHWDINFKIYYLSEKMRSQKDPYYSDLSDRVKVGCITEEDKKYLQSRVVACPSENSNANFKSGKLLIIVTTNTKRDFINQQKLSELLPNEREFVCNSVDMVTNLPSTNEVPETLKANPGKTGNLESQLKLKVGAPVLVTVNHSKQKY